MISNHSKTSINLLILIALLLPAFLLGCGGDEELIERQKQVIKVGDKAITIRDFKDRLKEIAPTDNENITEVELIDLKMNLVNRLIEEAVILKEAKRLRVNITEAHVDDELMTLKKELGDVTFKSIITTKFGNVDKWKVQIKRELTIKEAIDRAIHSRINISNEGARQYYEENTKLYKIPAQIRAQMIVVKNKSTAEKVLKKLKKGDDFAELAKKYSTGPEAKNGGDLGFFGKGEMPEEFELAIKGLRVGKISKITKTVYGHHIFKVTGKQKRKNLEFEDVKESIKEELKRQVVDREYHKWVIGLKRKIRIVVDEELILKL